MTALQPPDGAVGDATRRLKSFAAVVSASSSDEAFNPGTVFTFREEPALRITKKDILQLARPFQHALVGRFAYSRPPMEDVRKFFPSLGLKGECAVALLDANHVLIRPTVEEDYPRLFVRRTWFIKSSPMTISKWSLDFRANKEVSITPVWVSFPGLPLPFFGRNPLTKLASILGRLLKIDAPTGDLRRPSVARVLVEIEIAHAPVKCLWIGDEDYGFWQTMEYEKCPAFCSFCKGFGHDQQECFLKFLALKPTKKPQQMQNSVSAPTGNQGKPQGRGEDVGERRDLQQLTTGTEVAVERAPVPMDHRQIEATEGEQVEELVQVGATKMQHSAVGGEPGCAGAEAMQVQDGSMRHQWRRLE